MPLSRLGISWQINDYTSSGITALHLSLNLLADGAIKPLLYTMPRMITPPHGAFEKLRPFVDEMRLLLGEVHHSQKSATLHQALSLHGLFADMRWEEISSRILGRYNVGMSFCRELPGSVDSAKRARAMDRLIVRSKWHEEGLRELGLDNVIYWRPGYDDWLLYPREKSSNDTKPFTIYSAAPLHIANGQDIVVQAFRAFQETHPDARLVTSWHSPFLNDVATLELSPYGGRRPQIGDNNAAQIVEWLTGNGIAEDTITDCGLIGAQSRPGFLADADVALFPSRCSGGPDMYAVEAMAMGIPCILSANTGHLDLISDDAVLTLNKQAPVVLPSINTTGWGESDVDEIVAHLEWAYSHRDDLSAMGKRSAKSVKPFSWANQTRDLLYKLSDLLDAG